MTAKSTPTILHVSTWKTACGIATYCENLVDSLSQAGFRNEIAVLEPSNWKDFVPSDIAEWENDIVAQAKGADLVHIQHEHGLFGLSVGNRFAVKRFGGLLKRLKALSKPTVVTFHTDVCTKQRRGLRGKLHTLRRRRIWKKYITKNFGASPSKASAIVHARDTRRSLYKHGFPADALNVVPHACLAPRNITLDRAEAKTMLGLGADQKLLSIFGFVGRYKGHDIAIKALERLPEDYHLAVVGGMHPESRDTYLDKLLTTVPDQLKSRVHITGWVDRETADVFCAATDACLAPYRQDTLLSGSGALTWALSSGRPVIASKIEAFQHVNRLGNCMFMVTPEKPAELAWAIEKTLADEALSDRLVENARAFATKYSWESSVASILEVYRGVAPSILEDLNRSQNTSASVHEESTAKAA